MTQWYSNELAGIDSTPVVKPSATQGYGARVKRFTATIALASQASGDTVVLADVPAGFKFAYGVLNTDTSLGTATIEIGDASSAASYLAAETFTSTNTPTLFGKVAEVSAAASAASDRLILTVGTAALPASGTLVVDLYFSHPN